MTLVEFLEARISDDEDAARQSAGTEPLYQYPAGQGAHYELIMLGVSEGGCGSEEAAFMAHRFDPARVLAECAAKRRIIEWHVKTGEQRSRWDGECCEENRGEIEWLPEQEISVGITGSGQFWVREPFATQANLGCTTLRMMAAVWSSHPDYDPVWGTA